MSFLIITNILFIILLFLFLLNYINLAFIIHIHFIFNELIFHFHLLTLKDLDLFITLFANLITIFQLILIFNFINSNIIVYKDLNFFKGNYIIIQVKL